MKLKEHKYTKCDIFNDEFKIELYSYNSRVIMYDKKLGILRIFGLYSMTTRKHISWFISKYFGDILSYKNIKFAYENWCNIDIINKCYISIITGEVIKCGF